MDTRHSIDTGGGARREKMVSNSRHTSKGKHTNDILCASLALDRLDRPSPLQRLAAFFADSDMTDATGTL